MNQPKTWVDTTLSYATFLENANFTTCKWLSTCAESRHKTLFPQQAPRDVVKAGSGVRGSVSGGGNGGYRPKATPKNPSSAPVRTPTYNWTPGRIGGI